jgi:transposase-like protein
MTDDTVNLQALLGKSADADFLREMIGFAAQRLMDLEVGSLTGAGYGEKSSDRLVQRNGYRERVAAHTFDRQVTELKIRAAILNRFSRMGAPVTVRIA